MVSHPEQPSNDFLSYDLLYNHGVQKFSYASNAVWRNYAVTHFGEGLVGVRLKQHGIREGKAFVAAIFGRGISRPD